MKSFTLTRKINAPVKKVWEVAGDFVKSPGSGIIIKVEKNGDPTNNNIGVIRIITIGKTQVRERLESINPPKSFTYKLLSGAPLKDHRAKVELIPEGSTTKILWTVEFAPKFPGSGWIVGLVTKKALNQYIDAIEKASR